MINLLPPARLTNLRIARSNTILRRYIELILLSLGLFGLAVFAGYYFLHIQQSNTARTLELSRQKVKKLEPVQKQATELSATVNTIAGLFSSNNVKFSEMLTQIGGLMPDGSVLTGLQFSIEDLKSTLVVSAQVDTEQKAAILRNNLASSSLFSKVDIQTISQIQSTTSGSSTSTNSTSSSNTNSSSTTPTDTAPTSEPIQDSPYKFTAVLNAYLKTQPGAKK